MQITLWAAVIIPVAVFYVIAALHYGTRTLERRYGRLPNLQTAFTSRTSEMVLGAIVLDLAFFGEAATLGRGGAAASMVAAGVLMLFHGTLYLFAHFVERKGSRLIGVAAFAYDNQRHPDAVLLWVGMTALFTNAVSVIAVLQGGA